MHITSGLAGHMVLQRTSRNVCDVTISGSCTSAGTVEMLVQSAGKTVRGMSWRKVGYSTRTRFTARLHGIPTGGPYDIQLRILTADKNVADTVTVEDVLVGDVWILAGQSNMEGIGLLSPAIPEVPHVRAMYMNDVWGPAVDPIHNLEHSVDRVHAELAGGTPPQRGPSRRRGPGIPFAQTLYERTGVPQGLIACAHGGTSMTHWDPAGKKLGDRSLYGAMVRRFHAAGARVAGVFWYQGCSDATEDQAPHYRRCVRKLVRAFRRDFGNERLPVVVVQIGRVHSSSWHEPSWSLIREQQRLLADQIDHVSVVTAVDLTMDDNIHISGEGQIRLGRRAALAMQALQGKGSTRTGTEPPPRPALKIRDIRTRSILDNQQIQVTIHCANVTGSLRSGDRPAGFDLVDAEGRPAGMVYRVTLHRNRIELLLSIQPKQRSQYRLTYGYGLDPYCNITDEADQALPSFGPVALPRPQ